MSRGPLRFAAPVAILVATGVMPPPAAAGQQSRVPLREGLTIVTALNDPDKGDYESIKTILKAGAQDVRLKYLAEAPAHAGAKPERVECTRTFSRRDLKAAHDYRLMFDNGAPEVYEGSTAIGVSASVLAELKSAGRTQVRVPVPGVAGALGGLIGGLLGGASKALDEVTMLSGTVQRTESGPAPFTVLVNDTPVRLPAVHARGRLGDTDAEFWILDDADNPLALKWVVGDGRLQVVKLSFPAERKPSAATVSDRIEHDLTTAGRAVIYGIYFDFASDRIKDESEPVLKEIAGVMAKNPSWKLDVEGHTDSIGGAAPNLELSRRRAAAVRQALVARYHVAGDRLVPSGVGAARPKDTNDTLEGRARNRRVELVKQ